MNDGGPSDLAREIAGRTDVYFNRTRSVVERFGDKRVTYAIFLRRPVISAPRLMLDWLADVAAERGTTFDIDVTHPEGSWTGAGEPLAYIAGSFAKLADLETILRDSKYAREADRLFRFNTACGVYLARLHEQDPHRIRKTKTNGKVRWEISPPPSPRSMLD